MADLRFNVSAETRQATAALGSFARDMQKRLVNAVRALPSIELTADSSEAQKEMKRLRDALADLANKRVGVDIDAGDALAEMQRLQSELRALGGSTAEVGVRADVSSASSALGDVEAEVRRLDGTDAEVDVVANTDEAESRLSKFADAAKAGAAAAGVAAGGVLAAGLASSMEFGAAQARLEAQLGGTPEYARGIGEIAGGLYANAYGENLAEVGDAVRLVIQSGAAMEGATNEQLSSITGKIMSVAQAFDQDLGGTVNAVAQMIKTGLAKDADEALDIITTGFQNGADKAGDLLDTFNEYSTQFRKIGVDGKTAIGLISQGLQAGARDADIVADAFKEFSIRAVDGSKEAGESFKALGLDAGEMQRIFAKGGPEAAAALDLVMDRLRTTEGSADAATIAFGLFGTQSEDLGAALYKLDPSTATKGLGEVAGAAERLDAAMGATAEAKVTALQRGFEQWSASLIATEGPLGDVAAKVAAFGPMALTAVGAIAPLVLALRMGGVAASISGVTASLAGTTAAAGAASTAVAGTGAAAGAAAAGGASRLVSVLKFAGVVGAVGAVAVALDGINVAAAGGEENLDGLEENLHDIVGAGKQIASLDFGGIFTDIGSEWDSLVRQFESGTSDAGAAWGEFQREMSGFELTDIDIDVKADPAGAAQAIGGLMNEINGASAEVNINGNNTGAAFALRRILEEIAMGHETILIDGEPMPAQEALRYVLGLIDTGSGEVTINGQTMPASEALMQFMGLANGSVGTVTLAANPDPATGQLVSVLQNADGSTGTVTLDGDPTMVNGKTQQAVRFADGSRGTVTIDGNPDPATGKVSATVRYANGSTGTVQVTANANRAYGVLNTLYAQWNGRQINVNIGGSRVTAGGGVFGFAGGGMASGTPMRASRSSGMVIPGYAPGVDDIPTLMSRGESVLVPELTRMLGARRILAANREASGGRPATVVGSIASMMDGLIGPARASGGMVQAEDGSWVKPSFYSAPPDDDSFESNSYYSKNRGKAGAIQAEDGSWVMPSFYSGRSSGMVQAEDGSWVKPSFYSGSTATLGTFRVTARAMSGGGVVQAEDGTQVNASFYTDKRTPWLRAQRDGKGLASGEVSPAFWKWLQTQGWQLSGGRLYYPGTAPRPTASASTASRVKAAVSSPDASMRVSSGTVQVADSAVRAEVRALRADMAQNYGIGAQQIAELRALRGSLAARASATAEAAAGRVRSELGAW